MARYVILTHEPERLGRAYGTNRGWSVTPFTSAVEALTWERRARSEGAIVLDSRGWLFGVAFTLEAASDETCVTPGARISARSVPAPVSRSHQD